MSLRWPPELRIDRPTLYGFFAILLWGTTVSLARSLSEQIGSLTAASAVYLTGGALCLVNLFSSKNRVGQLKQLSRRYVIGCGVLFVLYMLALFLAIGRAANRSQALEVGLVNYLWPAFTILLSLCLLAKRARFWLVPGTLVALFGIFLVLAQGDSVSWASFSTNVSSNPMAYSLALVAAVSWGLYSNLTRRWAGPVSSGAVTLFIPVTGIVLLMLRLLTREQGSWQLRTIIEVAFMGTATAVAYALWDMAMRKGDVVLIAAGSYFTPLFSMLISSVYLNVSTGRNLWLGCLLIVVGSLVSWASVTG